MLKKDRLHMGIKDWIVVWSQAGKQAEGNIGDFAQLLASSED